MGTRQWQTSAGSSVHDNRAFRLWNTERPGFVAYSKRKYGINLRWFDDAPEPNITVVRRRTSRRPVEYGEEFALREARGGYIRYEKRKYGINLGWSDDPVFEWCFTGVARSGPFEGQKLGDSPMYISDVLLGLFNTRKGEHVVYGKRKYGINLQWA